MNIRFSYFKYLGIGLCSLFLLFACSKDDGPGRKPDPVEIGQLVLEVTASEIDEGDEVTFAVTADGKNIDADIYIDDVKIKETTQTFDKTGVYEVYARKDGYTPSEVHKIEVYRTNVYIAGSGWKDGDTKNVAMYWKNGQPVRLSDGTNHAYAYSVFVDNGDVYVAGEDGDKARYWKNGQPVTLSDGNNTTSISSIFVDNGEVYATGRSSNTRKPTATYWKNNKPIALSTEAENSDSGSIFVDKGNVYVAGTSWNIGGNSIAMYWENGKPITLSDGTDYAYAYSIVVDKGDVYVAGQDANRAVYWKNGKPIVLSDGSNNASARSILIDNGNVYVAGIINYRKLVYWKNGELTELTNSGLGELLLEMLYVLNDNVYVVGTIDDRKKNDLYAVYWKNGVEINLHYENGLEGSAVSSIFVTRTLGEK